jgi:hypothetical protein
MSLENRKRQFKMFMERGETELAEDQIKNKDGIDRWKREEEEPTSEEKEEEPKTKSKKGK